MTVTMIAVVATMTVDVMIVVRQVFFYLDRISRELFVNLPNFQKSDPVMTPRAMMVPHATSVK